MCAFVGEHLCKSIFCVILELNVLAYINLIKVTIDHLILRGIWKYFANCLLRQLLRTICTKATGHFMQFGNDVTVSRSTQAKNSSLVFFNKYERNDWFLFLHSVPSCFYSSSYHYQEEPVTLGPILHPAAPRHLLTTLQIFLLPP